MPRIVPGTAPPRLETKSSVCLPTKTRRTTMKAMTMPITPASGVATAERKVVDSSALRPR